MQDKYVNPFTNFGFKKLFGEESHKELLISFLNTLLPEKHWIQSLQYAHNGQQGANHKDIFELRCTSPNGERFIVELQKAKHNYFKHRSTYYATFPSHDQAKRGGWDGRLSAVYAIGILDFTFAEDCAERDDRVIHQSQLKDQFGNVLYDKVTFIYLALPNFNKTLEQLATTQDKWFYIFRHLHEMNDIPAVLQEKIFLKLFNAAQITHFDPAEREAYEYGLKYYRDLKNVADTAWGKGYEEGVEEGIKQSIKKNIEKGKQEELLLMAKKLLNFLSDADIAGATGLTVDEVAKLRG
ncbi:MAG: hypothetical protein CSB47_03850 [Proteobacteria bacterium]|nr:MAG: hypothetical protein CSB47_03850 [Pseudomonadota bacterium]